LPFNKQNIVQPTSITEKFTASNFSSCKFSSDTLVRQPQFVVLTSSEPTTGSDQLALSLENLQEEFIEV
jgi:hypothetical protein